MFFYWKRRQVQIGEASNRNGCYGDLDTNTFVILLLILALEHFDSNGSCVRL